MPDDAVPSITPIELHARLQAGEDLLIIDVREAWERKIVALPFTQNIRMVEILRRYDEIPRDRPVVLLCRTGSRSARTVEMLALHDFTNLLNLEGGILAWAHEVDTSLPQFYI